MNTYTKTSKRILAILLAVAMAFSNLPGYALAVEEVSDALVAAVQEQVADDEAVIVADTEETAPETKPVEAQTDEAEVQADQAEPLAVASTTAQEDGVATISTTVTYAVTDGNIYFDTDTGTITDADTTITSADIPASIEGVAVTAIGDNAFYNCWYLVSLTLPEGIESIGNSAFYCCWRLENFTIPDSVTSLGTYTFYACYALTNVVLPSGITLIPERAFYSCDALTTITLPTTITEIGSNAFSSCSKLTDVYYLGTKTQFNTILISSGNTYLTNATIDYAQEDPYDTDAPIDGIIGGNITFDLATGTITDADASITSADIPAEIYGVTVKAIGDNAFNGCTLLTSVTLPESVSSIGSFAFTDCKSLTSVTLPESLSSIGSFAFQYCTSLTSITLPENLVSIGTYAFSSSALTIVTFSDGVKTISSSAFYGCSTLTSIILTASVTTIEASAFLYCSSLEVVYFIGTESDFNAISISSGNTYLTNAAIVYTDTFPDFSDDPYSGIIGGSITFDFATGIITDADATITSADIPATIYGVPVVAIGDSAFQSCSELTSITLPDGIESIGSKAFWGCSSLTDITLPDSITSIGEYAFYICTSLTTLILPENLTTIETYLFGGCSSLTSIAIPYGVTSIGASAFMVTNLTNVELPITLESIGDSTFSVPLANVYYTGNETTWAEIEMSSENYLYYGPTIHYAAALANPDYTGTAWVTVDGVEGGQILFDYDTNTILDAEASITSASIPVSINRSPVLFIGDSAFADCTALTSISLPYIIASIGESAFANCTQLQSITLPESVSSIGASAFYQCTSLASVVLPTLVTRIEESTFEGCSSLTSITLHDAITYLGTSAFASSGLVSINVPDSVTEFGEGVFANCAKLEAATINGDVILYDGTTTIEGITTIPANTFANCTTLNEVYIPYSVTSIADAAFTGCTALSDVYYAHWLVKWELISIGADNTCLKDATLHCVDGPNGTAWVELEGVTYGQLEFDYDTGTIIGASQYVNVAIIPETIDGVTVTSIGEYAFEYCNDLTAVRIPDTVTVLETCAFYSCPALATVQLPDTLESIGTAVFSGAWSLCEIELPESLTYLGVNAFSDTGLITITIPSGITKIEAGTFGKNMSLITVILPDTITEIDESAFYCCEVLEYLEFPDGITNIAAGMFFWCFSLKAVSIPASVVSIDSAAFHLCYELVEIYYGGTEEQWQAITVDDTDNWNEYLYDAVVHYQSDLNGETGVTYAIPDALADTTTDDAWEALRLLNIARYEAGQTLLVTFPELQTASLAFAEDKYGTNALASDAVPSIKEYLATNGITATATNGSYCLSTSGYLYITFEAMANTSIISSTSYNYAGLGYVFVSPVAYYNYVFANEAGSDAVAVTFDAQSNCFILTLENGRTAYIAYNPYYCEHVEGMMSLQYPGVEDVWLDAPGIYLGDLALSLASIEITTAPTTTWYAVGDTFDATGMVVTATFSDGTTAIITDYSYDGDATNLQLGDSVTITYGGKTATQALTVIEPLSETDMYTLLDFVAGFETPTEAQLAQFDYTADGKLEIGDAIFYARFVQ